MSLLLGSPATWQELDEAFAALQTWIGKQEGAGKWIDVPYSAGLFDCSVGAWTVEPGDQRVFRYTVAQDVLRLRVLLQATSTSAAIGNLLYIRLPEGYVTTDNGYLGSVQWDSNAGGGTSGIGSVFGFLPPNAHRIALVRDVLPVSTAWPASEAHTFSVRLNLTIPVSRVGAV